MALSEEITERKRAEDALRASKAFLLDAQRLTRTCSGLTRVRVSPFSGLLRRQR
jgi:hypothetical protein